MQNAVLLPAEGAAARDPSTSRRYAQCIEASKRVRWDIDRDVIRGRDFDFSMKFLPDALSRIGELDDFAVSEQRLLSHIQGRTYANMFGLVERFIGAKITDLAREHSLGDQAAFEALVRFTDEELKHQALFRRVEGMIASGMPPGYDFGAQPDDVARLVLGKSTWAVLAVTCMIELFTQAHYRATIAPDAELSPLYKDVFLFHWREESQHAILDELEWRREHGRLTAAQLDAAVDDLIALVAAFDGLIRQQAQADAAYFAHACGRPLAADDARRVKATLVKAYRWQFILSGVYEPRFHDIVESLVTPAQAERIGEAIAPIADGRV